MQIATPFAGVLGRLVKAAQLDAYIIRRAVQVEHLLAFSVGVGVVENVFVARQIGAVTVDGHFLQAPLGRGVGLIGVEVKSITVAGVGGPSQNVVGISPDEMRGIAPTIHHTQVAAIHRGGHHAGSKGGARHIPAMQEFKALARGRIEQVIEPLLARGEVLMRIGHRGRRSQRNYQLTLAGLQIAAPNARPVGIQYPGVGIGDAA